MLNGKYGVQHTLNYEEISKLQFSTFSESMQSKIGLVVTVIIVARQGRAYHKTLFLLYITGSGQHIVQIGPSAITTPSKQ